MKQDARLSGIRINEQKGIRFKKYLDRRKEKEYGYSYTKWINDHIDKDLEEEDLKKAGRIK